MEAVYPSPPSRLPQPPQLNLPPGFQLPQMEPIRLPSIQPSLPLPQPGLGFSQFNRLPGLSQFGQQVDLGLPQFGQQPGLGLPQFDQQPGLGLPQFGQLPGLGLPQFGQQPGLGLPQWNQLLPPRAGSPPRSNYVSSSGRLGRSPPFALPQTSRPSPPLMAPDIRRSPPRVRQDFDALIADLLAERYPEIFQELAAEVEEFRRGEFNDY